METENDKRVDKIRRTCVDAALAAGNTLMALFGRPQKVHSASRHDLKVEADLLSEAVILQIIEGRFPGHTILSEETTRVGQNSDFFWVVDPLDGTVNFCHAIPLFGVSIACYQKTEDGTGMRFGHNGVAFSGKPLAGVVYHPVMKELFVGVAGGGATLNGCALCQTSALALEDAVISISFGSQDAVMQRMERLNTKLLRHVRKVRVFGATSIDLANIAGGRLSGLVQGCVKGWDFAAGRIILEESGARFSAEAVERDSWSIVAAHAGIFEPLERMMRQPGCP